MGHEWHLGVCFVVDELNNRGDKLVWEDVAGITAARYGYPWGFVHSKDGAKQMHDQQSTILRPHITIVDEQSRSVPNPGTVEGNTDNMLPREQQPDRVFPAAEFQSVGYFEYRGFDKVGLVEPAAKGYKATSELPRGSLVPSVLYSPILSIVRGHGTNNTLVVLPA